MQQLQDYHTPADWHPGSPWLQQSLWFCLGAPLLAARWLPGSAWRAALLRSFGARIGQGCKIKPGLRVKFPWRLVVGNHCWLAEDAWIDNHNFRSPGTRIGAGAVVALGSVVSGVVPPGLIMRGNPAVVVGPRLPAQQ